MWWATTESTVSELPSVVESGDSRDFFASHPDTSQAALYLNGMDNFLVVERADCGLSFAGRKPFTIEFVLRVPPDAAGPLLSVYNDGIGAQFLATITKDHRLYFQREAEPFRAASSLPIAERTWTHLAIVYNGDHIHVLREGYLDAVVESSAAPEDASHLPPLMLGTYLSGNSPSEEVLEVEIAEFRVWNKARSQTELARDMQAKLSRDVDGLVLLWRLDSSPAGTASFRQHVLQDAAGRCRARLNGALHLISAST